MRKIIILVAIFIFIQSVSAIPRIEPYVNDFAGVLSKEDVSRLNILADSIEKNTSYEIAIVIVQNTEGEDPVIYANKIGDENGVGKKDKDNGIVVLWSIEDKMGAIATGRYSESILNDAKVGRIGRESKPYFLNHSYYLGFQYILENINNEISSSELQASTNKPDEEGSSIPWIILAFIAVWLLLKFLRYIADDEDLWDVGVGVGIASSVLSSSSSSGSSFGGGSFGGGGSRI